MVDYYKWDISYKIIGCAINVHNKLWCWYQEIIYQRALVIEFTKNWLRFEREKEIEIQYDWHFIWKRRVDFAIEDDILLEIKSSPKIFFSNKAQILNYLQINKTNIWLLINFWWQKLEYYRFKS